MVVGQCRQCPQDPPPCPLHIIFNATRFSMKYLNRSPPHTTSSDVIQFACNKRTKMLHMVRIAMHHTASQPIENHSNVRPSLYIMCVARIAVDCIEKGSTGNKGNGKLAWQPITEGDGCVCWRLVTDTWPPSCIRDTPIFLRKRS